MAIPVLFIFLSNKILIHTEDYKISSVDGEFTLEVSREKQEVKILVVFRDATQFSHAVIEKSDDIKSEFRQCAYIDANTDVKIDGATEKKDKYPRVYSDSFYRLRTVSKEGIERSYPAVRLPAKTE